MIPCIMLLLTLFLPTSMDGQKQKQIEHTKLLKSDHPLPLEGEEEETFSRSALKFSKPAR